MKTVRELLKAATLKREYVDRFIDPYSDCWAKFDAQLGYTLRNSFVRDGVDGSASVYRYSATGERKMINYPDNPCRINTYGDSFTQCHQVSDGETWQEVLAAHLGEPIRNFGIGGYGVYQAYRRMLRHEATEQRAPYLLLNIWGDDHHRSLMAMRWINMLNWGGARDPAMFHGNPWCHVRIDPATLQLIERPSLCSTPESLYELCDEERMYEVFHDDLVVKILVAQDAGSEVDTTEFEQMAEALGLELDFDDPDTRPATATTLYNECAWLASRLIVEKAKAFAEEQGRKLMILLSYPQGDVAAACRASAEGRPLPPVCHGQSLREYLADCGLPVVDSLPKHVEEFKTFTLSPGEYAQRHYIGHYNPTGNHFFAYAIKDELVEWLDPKPIAYRATGIVMRFEDYLPK